MGKNKNKTKNELVFDNKQREEFLKGFSKRKKQRQRKAQKEIDIKFKEERKRIKDEAKNIKDKFKQSYQPIEELKGIVSDEEEDYESVTVSITPIIKPSSFIGYRKVEIEVASDEEEACNDHDKLNEIKGMELNDNSAAKQDSCIKLPEKTENIRSEKDFKKMIKKQTISAIKKSKIIQKKNQLNHKRNIKLSQRKKFKKEKFLRKHKKIPKHKMKE